MSPKLARLTGKEMCSILEQSGFVLKRVKGSHHIYARPGLEGYVTVPVHGNEILKPKTLKSIIKQAELNIADFTR
ncbi:MAG TPA: type II toxin-antitoxin system HicA family toxin [bacterium]|nr:type II toxin-antitoxin system HicA family toxin [bacterium]